MKLLRIALPLLWALFIDYQATAQTDRAGQYFSSPLSLNPALTGQLEGSFRLAAQVPSLVESFHTSAISIDAPVVKRTAETDEWGIGFRAMSGRAANNSMMSDNFSFSTSYMKGLDTKGWKQLGIGIQAGYQKNSMSKTPYQQQGVDPYMGIPIPLELMKVEDPADLDYPSFFDLSAGALYTGSNNGLNNYYVGLSTFHLNTPTITVKGKKVFSLAAEVVLHGGFSYPAFQGKRTLYFSSFISQQANITTLSMGGVLGGFASDNGRQLQFGGWAKYNTYYSALIPYVNLEHKSLQIALSYNIVVTRKADTAPVKKGAEISLIYVKKSKKQEDEERRPRPRY
jgi:type IX secretion system PorP/SprF family membrane protein